MEKSARSMGNYGERLFFLHIDSGYVRSTLLLLHRRICSAVFDGALTLGFAQMALTAARTEKVRFGQLFDGFKNYGSSLALYILILIFTFLWTLLLIIPGIIKSYSYSMSYFILADHPQMPANHARKYSIELMKGNKWRLFCLDFSFIGWILLSILTLGILSFWIVPYRETARAEFYRYLVSEDEKNVNTAPEVSK